MASAPKGMIMVLIIAAIFILGYLAIALEHPLRINKAATALLTGVLCWAVFALMSDDKRHVAEVLTEHLGELSGILFFLLGAMTIVELIDAHDGFHIVTSRITTLSKKKLIWIISILSFFLSAVLDNLTTAIVMVSLLQKLIPDKKDRLVFCGIVIISANAGGAWSPIGDVTTTMLWIGEQITATNIIITTIVPSLVCMLVPVSITSFMMKGTIPPFKKEEMSTARFSVPERNTIFWTGVGCLLFVPVFKTVTDLQPYMGILFGLGLMWLVTEVIHRNKPDQDKDAFSVSHALRKVDTPSVLFFLGILLSVAALQSIGVLGEVAAGMDSAIGDIRVITMLIGVLSAIVDNVPLVAAAQGMYSLEQYPTDHYFWEFLAYCAGTGGSILVIGSAAGVAAMGIEKIEFFWYVKRISILAILGYLAGAGVFLLQQQIFR